MPLWFSLCHLLTTQAVLSQPLLYIRSTFLYTNLPDQVAHLWGTASIPRSCDRFGLKAEPLAHRKSERSNQSFQRHASNTLDSLL